MKRDMVSRGTTEEKTKTNLRAERFLDGEVVVLRLELPLPDEKQDMAGDPLQPRLGDIKGRIGFRGWRAGDLRFPFHFELSLPTADPESLGAGKAQISAAQRVIGPARLPFLGASHRAAFEIEVEQTVSFGGDRTRSDVNTTTIELTLADLWRDRYTFQVKLKPVIDWVEDGDTGAVAEIEGGVRFGKGWRTWLMLGRRVWGASAIASTYEDKVEIGLSRAF